MINTIPEVCANMEEGIIDEAVPSSTASDSSGSSGGKKRLSTVSKMYDVNGDGELDEAELASKCNHWTHERVSLLHFYIICHSPHTSYAYSTYKTQNTKTQCVRWTNLDVVTWPTKKYTVWCRSSSRCRRVCSRWRRLLSGEYIERYIFFHISLCVSYVMRIIYYMLCISLLSLHTSPYSHHIFFHIILHNTSDFLSSSSSWLYPILVHPSPPPYSPRIQPRTPRVDHLN